MKHRKVLSWVVTLALLFSLTGGMQTAWATGPIISADKTTLENGVLPQTIVITLSGDTFESNLINYCSMSASVGGTTGPEIRSIGCKRDSDTQITVTINASSYNNLREGSVKFRVAAGGLSGGTESNTLTFAIPAATALTLNENTLKTIKKGDYYSHRLSVSGGNGSKTFQLLSGPDSLPAGLTFDASGLLSGTPTTVGNYNFTVSATDSAATPVTVSKSYSISVTAPALSSDGNYMVMNGIIYSYKGTGTDVTIPSKIDDVTITEIAEQTFMKTNVENVVIPSSVTTIGDGVFKECSSLKSVTFPDSITSMGRYVFFKSSIENVNIPTGIKVIPSSSFAYCSNLEYITIPDNIEEIGSNAFCGCTALKSVTIPGSVSKIGDYAFSRGDDYYTTSVSKLTQAIFKGNAPAMGTDVFYYPPLGFKIYYPNNKTGYSANWNDYDCVDYNPGSSYIVDYNANGGTGSTIPSSVTGINTGGEMVVAANTLTKEGHRFRGWNTEADGTGIEYAPGDILTVAASDLVLYAHWVVDYVIHLDPDIVHGSIKISVHNVESNQAEYNDYVLVTVTPDSGYRLQYDSLQYTAGTDKHQLQEGEEEGEYYFLMPENGVTVSAIFESEANDYGTGDMEGYESVSRYYGSGGNIVIPSEIAGVKIQAIKQSVFSGKENITGVTMPEGVMYIGYDAFAYCSSMSAISLPSSVYRIDSDAFDYCTLLKSVRIPASTAVLGDTAFADCDKLESAIFEGNAPGDAGNDIFANADSDFTIYYKEGATGFDAATWTGYTQQEYKYLVKYNYNGATSGIAPGEQMVFTDGSTVTVASNSANLARTGYTFSGWNTAAEGTGTAYAPGASMGVTNDITLYAQWKAVDNGSGSNHHNGGKSSSGGTNSENPVTTDDQKNGSTGGFSDTENHWAKEAVAYVTEKGMFGGTGNGKFSPDLSMNRGMLVTVLGRIWSLNNGSLDAENAAVFGDVKADAYYSKYVSWAAANGIAAGVGNGEFAPGSPVTREQLVTMIYNYAKYAGLDVTDDSCSTIEGYGDSDQISDWAATAMAWAVHKGLLSGKGNGNLDPKGTATRAEVAKIIEAFMQQVK